MNEGKKHKILIIDDDVKLSSMIQAGLQQYGYEVLRENVSTRGVAAAEIFSPDLVLLDLDMPDMDGGTVAAEMRGNSKTKDIPIIFLSGLMRKSEVEAVGGKMSGRVCLAKPAKISEITEKIEGILGKLNSL